MKRKNRWVVVVFFIMVTLPLLLSFVLFLKVLNLEQQLDENLRTAEGKLDHQRCHDEVQTERRASKCEQCQPYYDVETEAHMQVVEQPTAPFPCGYGQPLTPLSRVAWPADVYPAQQYYDKRYCRVGHYRAADGSEKQRRVEACDM